MEQNLNYILMIKYQNILAILMIFLSQLKPLMNSSIQQREIVIAEIFSKISNIFVEKVTKSINSPTNIKSTGNDSVKAKFYKHLSNELSFNVYQ